MDIIPKISINASRICLYNEFSTRRASVRNAPTWQENFKDNSTKGIISRSAFKKIHQSIDWLIFLSPWKKIYDSKTGKKFKFKLNFVTLTLPCQQFHDDNFIKKYMLSLFIQNLRDKFGVKFYLWRAEAQKNGNIHFHITTNVFMEWWILRKIWNRILDKYGYLKHYSRNQKRYFAQGFKMSDNPKEKRGFRAQYKAYIWNSLIDWQDPNSTDVHGVYDIKNLSAYLSKYMTKNSDERPIEGRLWFMSQELSKLGSASEEVYPALRTELDIIYNAHKSSSRHYDYADILYLNYSDWKTLPVPELRKIFESYFNETMFNINFKI